jgi:pimeloyl-ACP methyl ester carboxylesterase
VRVVAPDLRGHGRSDHAPPGSAYHATDLLGDLDRLTAQLPAPFTLVGHSMGAALAALLAVLRPERVLRVVLVETVVPAEGTVDAALMQLSGQLALRGETPAHPTLSDLDEAAERLRRAVPRLDPSVALRLAGRITVPRDGGLVWRTDPRLRTRAVVAPLLARAQHAELLRRLPATSVVVHGRSSDRHRPEDLAWLRSALPQARWAVLPGGHDLPLETPGPLAHLIAELLLPSAGGQ